jgi:MFS family permease
MDQAGDTAQKVGYVWLQPGVTRRNGWSLLFCALTGIPVLAFINFIQPVILEVILGIPRDNQGALTANLAVAQELILLGLVGPFGALSDRIGRRAIVACGYLIVGAGFFAYPWVESALQLTLVRAFYAIGAAAIVASYSALLADYPQERSRGKLVALLGVLNGLGIVLLGTLGGNLPNWLANGGFSEVGASRIAMASVTLMCVLSASILFTGFRGGRPGTGQQRQPLATLLRTGLAEGRNPRIAVAYAAAFAARGDVVVIGTYVSLWISQAGIAQGLSATEAQGRAGIEFGIINLAALVAAPLLGILNDRIERVSSLAIGMALAALGYLAFGLQTNPLADFAYVAAILLGIGQMSSILAGQTLISQEARPEIAGSVIGVFSFFGAIGTLVGSWVGGQLFGLWRPGAPFLLMGAFNFLILLAALWVRARERHGAAAATDLLASSTVAPEDRSG